MGEEDQVEEVDVDVPLAVQLKQAKQKKKTKTKTETRAKKTAMPRQVQTESPPGITISVFDYSVENHFKAVDAISELCGDAGSETDESGDNLTEVQRVASSITFLREWRCFNYPSIRMRFACQNQSLQENEVTGDITLPQFSAATVPKKEAQKGETMAPMSSKDFVMYAGGLVWALDWCPRGHDDSDSKISCEFVAIAAHPPESSYHKIGAPLSGRGVIQIWSILNVNTNKDADTHINAKSKCSSRKGESVKDKSDKPKRPRGRPRRKPIDQSVNSMSCNSEDVEADAVQNFKDLSSVPPVDVASGNNQGLGGREESRMEREVSNQMMVPDKSLLITSKHRRLKDKARSTGQVHESGLDLLKSSENVVTTDAPDTDSVKALISEEVVLPRMMLCLAHNGKVAWDVKWRPTSNGDRTSKHRMGYLAVLLGSGALEVWEVPFPRTVKLIYPTCQKEGTDPRFIKLEPVLRCSMLKCGNGQSIPLTVEWSASAPHDMILVGCHDGVVALWKFSTAGSSKDARPLLCFTADTGPIRALAWAPDGSDSETANIIVTAGHKGLKFWDIRDPFHPLWDFNPVQRIIYSLDWLSDPKCIIVSFDDGTLRILSLVKAACDVPVTGKPFVGTQQQGFHSYYCSSSPLWSVQASRVTGMVAYCGADGTALRFQLTTRAVEKDPLRNRAPHFLCGSAMEEESVLTVISPLANTPFPMKRSLNEWGNAPRTKRGFQSILNQEKRAKEEMAISQTSDEPLELCYGDDPGIESGSDDVLVAKKRKGAPTLVKHSDKKSRADELAIVCRDPEPDPLQREEGNKGKVEDAIDHFPPKIVAMHRVRWNMNRGSERWLCYGGAAGVIRCQEIEM